MITKMVFNRLEGESHDEWWKRIGEKESNETWMRIRKRGELTCHDVSIPSKCSQGICDRYPYVKLCAKCKKCPCG
mgnify:FL=1|jgi:hypothetical protein